MTQPDDYEYEYELTAGPADVAAVLSGVTDGVLAGSVRVGEDEDAVAVDVPEELDLEVELELEDGAVSLELELEWDVPDEPATPAVEGSSGATEQSESVASDSEAGESHPISADDTGEEGAHTGAPEESAPAAADPETPVAAADPETPVGATDATSSLARFEVFRDRADEWRWRLRHRNGNVIATSGEGYTRKHNAWKGLTSVMRNAPAAEVREDPTD
ncbi:MAG: amphi-Trp domain-containing protein [Haloarculaceae archaeon]